MSPDKDQQAVINIAEGEHLVLAPPGCGKTFILAERVVHAHAQGVRYEDMMCLTFTNRASRSMRDRVSQRTGNPVPPDLFVGNVHRFCSNYLFGEKKIPQNSAVIDDLDAESIISYLAHLDPREDHSRFASEIVNLQHALSQQEAGMPFNLIVHNDLLNQPDLSHRVALAQKYAEYKDTDTLLDFEDLLEKAYFQARADREAGKLRLYKWIQIDEVQDLNFLQFAIIDLFAAPDATIVYLGDEQQAIFSFVGAKLNALNALKKRCEGHIHHLGQNHRSPAYLLELFNAYAEHQLGIDPAILPVAASHNPDDSSPKPQDRCLFRACYHNLSSLYYKENMRCPHDGTPCTLCRKPYADEFRLAVSLAKRYAEIEPEGRVAIIVSTNADADRIARQFGDTPHFKISGRDLFATPSMQLITSHLNVVASETCFIAWAKILYYMHIVPDYSIARNLMREMRSRALSPTDLLMYQGSSYLQQFAHTLDNETIVLFDTETTGLDVAHDDIIQIAAVKVCQGRIVEGSEFNIIIETDKEIPPIVGGHDNPMLEVYLNSERLTRAEGLKKFLEYAGDATLFGHNVEYDYHILDANLLRTLGQGLGQRKRFDTLKLIRLVEPRLRIYKLERLLETLHLEGTNSHNAIDDVLATYSLLAYCREKAQSLTPLQQQFLNTPEMRTLANLFNQRYLNLYLHSYNQLYTPASLVDEAEYFYQNFLQQGLVEPIEKWPHVVNYLRDDLVAPSGQKALLLREQLDRYLPEINTLREADLCDSESMKKRGSERFFIATAHKAKGLEFDSVVVFGASEGAYPYFFNIRNGNTESIQEDARRLYVALSRARKHLCITYSHIDARGQVSQPSRFLSTISPMLTLFPTPSEGDGS